jgi:putative DNA primase/helicase
MRQDWFDYLPTYKLMIAGNFKPRLKSVNEATRRRFQMLEWGVNFANPDRELKDKLLSEGPAILRWMLDGCLDWQRQGLNPPNSVLAMTAKYLEMEDSLGQWLAERCELNPNFSETSAILFESWKQWSELAREFTGNRKDFCKALEARGIAHCELGHKKTAGYRGLRVCDQGSGAPPIGQLATEVTIDPMNSFAACRPWGMM